MSFGARASSYALGGLPPVAEDTFTRANSTTLGNTEIGGFAWTEHFGNLQIVSNGVQAVYAGGSDHAATFDAGVADCTVTANIRTATAADRTILYLLLRRIDANNFWWLEVNDYFGDSSFALRKNVGGSVSYVTTYAAGFGPNEDHELVAVMNGSSWECYLDGVLRLTATDSSGSGGTTYGVRCYTDTLYDDGTSRLLDIKVEA